MRLLTLLLLCSFALLASGCLWHKKPKNETHIYGGEAPTITYSKHPDRAGGALRTY